MHTVVQLARLERVPDMNRGNRYPDHRREHPRAPRQPRWSAHSRPCEKGPFGLRLYYPLDALITDFGAASAEADSHHTRTR